MENEKRVMVFIDAENVRNYMEEHGYVDLDYVRLIKYLKNKKNSLKEVIFVAIEETDLIKEKKYKDLEKLGYEVNIKKVQSYIQKPYYKNITCIHCQKDFVKKFHRPNKKKGNCDAELTLKVVIHADKNNFDEAIIFSGDGDFSCVYQYLVNDLKKKVTLIAPLGPRTHTNIKNMGKKGMINIENLGSLIWSYGEKMPIV